MGTDCTGPDGQKDGNNVSLSLTCSSDAEIDRLYSKFSDGGRITCPLQDMFWGDKFGTVEDKFGINWMFTYDKNVYKSKEAQAEYAEASLK